nr:MAG TPA: hypothetical protein [Caudoviricetes sp.]
MLTLKFNNLSNFLIYKSNRPQHLVEGFFFELIHFSAPFSLFLLLVFCYFLKLDYSIIRFFRIVNSFYQKNRIFSYF